MATSIWERPTHSRLLRVTVEVRLYMAWDWRWIHLHLRHSVHVRTVGRLLYHHVPTHLRTLRTKPLVRRNGTHGDSWAHAIRWHCSWVVLHWRMQLRVVCHRWMAHARRWLYGRIRGCILHTVVIQVCVGDEVRLSLILPRRMLCRRHRRGDILQVWRELVLMRQHTIVRSV